MKPVQNLGAAIAADRARLNISQEQIAAGLKVTQQAVSGWESGESMPRGQRLWGLAEFFGPDSETANLVRELKKVTNAQFNMMRSTGIRAQSPFMGRQTGSGEKQPPPEDTNDIRSNEEPTAYIPSFETRPPQSVSGDVQDALTRAQHGVQLARQVLDDAANQLARALSQIPK